MQNVLLYFCLKFKNFESLNLLYKIVYQICVQGLNLIWNIKKNFIVISILPLSF